jgi:hypothetical protein
MNKKEAAKGVKEPPKTPRLDWEAIERDHATGKYTDGELAAKHKTSRETIVRRRTRDQKADPRRWKKDLRKQVREATQAMLVHAEVTRKSQEVTATITGGHTSTAILAAAEMSKQVILQHRTELQSARELAMELLGEVRASALLAEQKELIAEVLAGESATPAQEAKARQAVRQALDTGSRVASVKQLAETLTKLHAGERVAFSLDDEEAPPPDSPSELSDEELDRRINERLNANRAP